MEDEESSSSTSSYTVDDALGSMEFGKFQALALAYSGTGYAAEAMEVMLLSYIGGPVQSEWKLSSAQQSLITSVVFAGMLLGAYTWGIVSDSYGRRKGFLFTALVTSVAGFLVLFLLIIFLSSFFGLWLVLGWEVVQCYYLGSWSLYLHQIEAVMPSLGWRWLLGLSALPSFLLLLFYGFVPESPRYLCMKGRVHDAIHVLERVAKLNNKPLPYGTLISECKLELEEKLNPTENDQLIPLQKQTPTAEKSEYKIGGVHTLCRLLSPKLIRSTLLLWMDFFGNSFAYYGIVLLTSELVNEKRYAVMFHSSKLVNANPYKDVFITNFAEIPGFLLSAAILDRLGRKISMFAMLSLSGIFLIPLIFHQTEVLTTSLLFGARICITGSFNILYIYAPEVYPTSVRSTGFGIASSVGRIGGIICPLVAVGLVEGCHQAEAVLLFELVIILSGLAVLFFPFETKGRDLSDSV